MHLRGHLAELMVSVAPKIHSTYVHVNNKRQTMLYVELTKTLYGMMQTALLFYMKFVSDLKSVRFSVNPYDACVANESIND